LATRKPAANTGYRFTPEAAADLFEIWSYIASDNAEAERTLKRPLQAEARSTSSSLGLPQAELGPPVGSTMIAKSSAPFSSIIAAQPYIFVGMSLIHAAE
jgi:plasmid stabilization system protein ParE